LALAAAGGLAHAGATVDVRLGNNTEGTTRITNGPNANQVAALDGYDVVGIPVEGNGRTQPHMLFDVRSVPWGAFPSGIAYIPTDKTFVFDDQGNLDALTFVDGSGHEIATTPITYRPDSPPVFSAEGLEYLPAGSAFPDTIARAIWDGTTAYIEIISRSGVVQRDIPLALPADESYVTGLTYLQSGRFLVSTGNPNIWTIGLDGSVLAGPTSLANAADIEGLTALPSGRVLAADYTAGTLFSFDSNLNRDPARDRQFPIGPGVSRSFDAAWDPVPGSFAVLGLDRDHQAPVVADVSNDLTSLTRLFHPLAPSIGLTVLPDGSAATCRFAGRRLDHYGRDGTLLSSLDLGTVGGGLPARRCTTLAYLPAIDGYALGLAGAANQNTVFLVSSAGVFLGSFSAQGPFVLSAPPGGTGNVVDVATIDWTVRTYDTTGTLVAQRSLATGNLVQPNGYAAGPGGSYALLDANDSELAIFTP
jgi:hypothetical protein